MGTGRAGLGWAGKGVEQGRYDIGLRSRVRHGEEQGRNGSGVGRGGLSYPIFTV